jgi:hypothetical protein
MRAMDIETDRKLIAELGGPSRVASMLGIDDKGTQRVHNWMRRGIPAAVRVEHPHLFMPTLAASHAHAAQSTPESNNPQS